MSLAQDLAGVGMPTEQAIRLGYSPNTLAGIGTAQVGAAVIRSNFITATTAVGQTAFVLDANAELMVPHVVFNSTATDALVFPPTGGFINAVAVNTSVTVAQNVSRIFMRLNATRWASWLAA